MSIANAATLTVGAETANAITVNVQLNQTGDNPISQASVVDLYLSSDAAGQTVVNAAGTGIVPTAGADGSMIDTSITTTQAAWKMVSESDGDLDVVLTNAGDETESVYLNLRLPNSKVVTSTVLAFVDDTP